MAQQKTAEAKVTTDHDEIREWVEARGGKPAAVAATHRKSDAGILRLMFPEAPQAEDEAGLALIYQETTAKGQPSLFTKLVGRETAEARQHGEHHSARHKGKKK